MTFGGGDYTEPHKSAMIRVAVPDLVSPSYFPAIAAVELGFFKREGLEATLELLYPVTRTYEELREGRLDFVGGASHAALYAFKDWNGGKLHCAIEVIKLAGFSADAEPSTRVDHAEVWLAAPRPGAPFLPERIEFAGSWGPIRVSLVDPAPAR